MVVSDEPQDTIDGLKYMFKLKGDKAEILDIYLGASLSYAKTINGNKCWSISSVKHTQTALYNVEKTLRKSGGKLPTKCVTPTTYEYRPEEDEPPELVGEEITYFQELIGILRWTIEMGRTEILLEVTILSFHLASPRKGTYEAGVSYLQIS